MHIEHSRYSGWPHGHGVPWGYAPYPASGHGFCRSCGHPASSCCCVGECRKEARELLVRPGPVGRDPTKDEQYRILAARSAFMRPVADAFQKAGGYDMAPVVGTGQITYGTGAAFIGGGCCVHLSIEYAPSPPTAMSVVAVLVDDAQGTVMAWGRLEKENAGYQVKEGIITTKPGADLHVMAVNMTVRLRWCEVFSC
jgi:hypothetical protein